MDLSKLGIFQIAKSNTQYLSERQKVLATNIANSNTPNYLPQDVERPNFSNELAKVKVNMAVTNDKHIAATPSQGNGRYNIYTPKPTTVTMDGNGVVIEDQINEVSKTKGEHDRVLTIYNKYKDLLRVGNTKINS